jgi:CBS domain-containing protein
MSGATLGTLVTFNPWTVGPTAALDDIAARFDELHIHHVPVVDGERHVLGMISETDLLRAKQAKRSVSMSGGAGNMAHAAAHLAREAMTRDVVSIATTTEFREALGLLLSRRIHVLPAVEGGRLVGLISSRDFLREFSYGELPGSREPIASLLRGKPPEPAVPDTTLDEALLLMQETGVNCLVIGQGDCPIGIVCQRDIVREKCRLEEQDQADHQAPRRAGTLLQITRNCPPIRSGHRLCEAAAAMIDHSLPAVTIVNQSNRLLGLITEDDLLRVLYDALA